MKGIFFTLEGIDGCGKSTHAHLLKEHLESRGIDVILTHEPGGTPLGNEIKKLLLSKKYGKIAPVAELLLFAADRAQHVADLIRPSLEAGKCVISSRFADATWVYQGVARNLNKKLIQDLAAVATGGLKPDVTFLLDLDPEKGLKRTQHSHKEHSPRGEVDRIEAEGVEFQKKVRAGYLELAKAEPQRFHIISTEGTQEEVQEQIRQIADEILAGRKV